MAVKNRSKIFLGVGLVTLMSFSFSAKSETLMDLYGLALESDPTLKTAEYDRQAAEELIDQAWSGYLPTVTLDYDQVETTQDIISSDNTVFQSGSTSFPSTTLTLTLTQPIIRYANYIRIGQAEEELKKADAELIQSQQEMMIRVTEAYFETLVTEDELKFLAAEQLSASKKLEEELGKKDSGTGRAVDLYDAEARLATVEADIAEAEVERKNAYDKLYEITGKEVVSLSALEDSISLTEPVPGNVEHWMDMAMKNNPAVVVQRHSVDVSRLEIDRQNAGHYPTMDLVYRMTKQETQGTLFGGGSDVETQEALLRFNLPIYAGGSVSSKKREAVANSFSTKSELTKLLRESRSESRKAFWGTLNAIKRVKALEKAVMSQEETLHLRRVSYDSGLETAMNVLDAERDFYSAKRDLSQAKYDYVLNGLRLKAMVGILTKDDLEAVNGWLK